MKGGNHGNGLLVLMVIVVSTLFSLIQVLIDTAA